MESQNVEYKKTWRALHRKYAGLDYVEIITEKNPFPVSYHGKYYRRTGSTMQEVSGLELDKMILSVQGRTWNDGALPKEVPVEDLFKEHVSKPCNPNLANVFFKCGMIESWARGFSKITRYCEEENVKLPVIDLSLGGVTARCFASDKYLALMNEHQETENVPLSPKMSDKDKTTQKTREKILALIRENNKITTHELAEALSLTDKGIEWQIKQLKDKNVITRVGADKGGYWEIVSGAEK